MSDDAIKPERLNPGRLLRLFAVLSVAFVGVLAFAPARPYFSEWREIQQRYNRLAEASGAATVPVAVQQIWKPKLGATDRCVTCHLGMGTAAPLAGDSLFQAHPPIPHDPKEFGCTVCHGGQGRATTKDAAHGFVSHWDEQMLNAKHLSAGCGTCHNSLPFASRRELERGRHLVESLDCLSCHEVDKRGRGEAGALTYAGIKGFRADWHAWHLAEQTRDATGKWQASYGAIPPEDVTMIDRYLRTRVGAPRIIEAQALAMERGCLGCHKINGRGGDEGPALDAAGRKPVGDLTFDHVPGERTLVNYMRRHLLDPAGVVPGSLMPPPARNDEEADLLTSYVLSLRSRPLPPEFLPKDRLRRELLGETPAPLSGEQLYQAYCSACHAARGEGRNYGALDVRFPAIGAADFLDVASDAFLESTLKLGRPGRRMPALGAAGASLSEQDVKAIVAHLRSWQPSPPAFVAVERAASDRALGERLYRNDCAACHGNAGEGTVLGSPLTTADSRMRGRRAEAYRALTGGVPGTAMPKYSHYDAAALKSLLDYLASLPAASSSRASWRLGAGNAASGKLLYGRSCAGCHGEQGQGKLGPALANTSFMQAATGEYLAATIVRGRAGTPMPAFGRDSVSFPKLTAAEVLDITAFLRQGLAGKTEEKKTGSQVKP
jgi:mono/diheme cytochrome c family protein